MNPLVRSSEMDRALSCNGSLTLTRIVDQREGDEGHEGVMIHWMIADRCVRELGAIPPDGGLPAPEVPAGYKLPKNSLWIVDWAIRHVQETIPADWSLMVEVEMEHRFGRWTNKGHADIVAISSDGKKAKGKDWKTGRDPVDPADNNEQVGSYTSLIHLEWPSIEEVEFEICQPRISDDDEHGFQRVSTVTVTDLPGLIATMDRRMGAALDNPMHLKTGKQCGYCIGCSCPCIQAEQQFMDLTMTPEMLAKIKKTPDDAQLADFVIIGSRLEKPLKDAKEMLHKRIDATPTIVAGCGTTITRKVEKGSYTIPDPLAFFGAVKELLPSDASIAKVMTPSMSRIRDEVAATMNIPKGGKGSVTSETVFDAKLRPLVEQGERRILVYSQ